MDSDWVQPAGLSELNFIDCSISVSSAQIEKWPHKSASRSHRPLQALRLIAFELFIVGSPALKPFKYVHFQKQIRANGLIKR